MKDSTIVLHSGFRSDPATGAICVPVYMSTAYELLGELSHIADVYNVKADGYTYSRIINPTTRVLERRFAAMEAAGDVLAVASGQAANFLACVNLSKGAPGGNIITSPYLYGNSWNLLHNTFKRLGIEVRVGDPLSPPSFERLVDDQTIAIFGESISNPRLSPLPVRSLAEIGKRHGVPVILDNTTTPLVVRPGRLGTAISTYSATKYVCGHGTTLGGLIVDHGNFDFAQQPDRFPLFNGPDEAHGDIVWSEAASQVSDLGGSAMLLKARMTWLRDTGACISPFNSFQLLQGLETLPLRMARHCESAMSIATALRKHPKIKAVRYPAFFEGAEREFATELFDRTMGFGAMLTFDLADIAAGRTFIQSVELAYHASNVGDARTLVTHPASTTHTTVPMEKLREAGIHEGSVRLCVGLEDPADILRDLEQALAAI